MKCIREIKRKNGIAFAVQIRLKGVPPLRATFETEAKAKKFVKEKTAIVTTGGKWNSAKIENTTLDKIFADFVKSVLCISLLTFMLFCIQ